jgi:chitinase
MSDSNKQARTRKYQSLGFGGTSDWAIDLQGDVGDTDDDPDVVYLGPPIYSGTPAQCTPPCLFVLPPSILPSATTIKIPAYITSIELESGTVSTITVTPPPLTVTSMDFWNVNISKGETTGFFQPTYSLDLPPYVTTVRIHGGLIQTRTLTLPPWPLITNGPPDTWNFTSGPGPSSSINTPSWSFPMPPENPTPITLPAINKPEYTGFPVPDPTIPWPMDWELLPVPTPVKEEGEDDDGDGSKAKSTCKLWFFFVCIDWDGPFNIHIQGWEWNLPVGIWGP